MTFLTVAQVAERLVCSHKTVRGLIASGRLRAVNLSLDSRLGVDAW
jgi:excisionase family DNA binding protein